MPIRNCNLCNEVPARPGGLRCKRCEHLEQRYGMSMQIFRSLLIAQQFECYICGSKIVKFRGKGSVAVDHDHLTGEIRGLACVSCNNVIGKLGDSAASLRAAATLVEMRS